MPEEHINCPVVGCDRVLDIDQYKGFNIYICEVHGEISLDDIADMEELNER